MGKAQVMNASERILVVDDDPRICRLLDKFLSREGYLMDTVRDAKEMRKRLDTDAPDMIILDLMLPGEDGFSIVRQLRKHSNIPVIMLTGKGNMVDKVVGLEMGADDYVTKPFNQRELLARVRTVMRRSTQANDKNQGPKGTAVFNGWKLGLESQELISPTGDLVPLTNYEFRLLVALVGSPNRVLNRDRLLEMVAGRGQTPFDRSIDVMVGKVRRKIEADPKNPRIIKTIRGGGYKLTAQVEYV